LAQAASIRAQLGRERLAVIELHPRGGHVDAVLEQPADHVDLGLVRHVDDAVGPGCDDRLDVLRRDHPGRRDTAEIAGVLARLGARIDAAANQIEPRMLDDRTQRVEPDIARAPLRDAVAPVLHALPFIAPGDSCDRLPQP
jgi:hypothetical protein